MTGETIISLIALGVAALSFGASRAQVKRTQVALARMQEDLEAKFEAYKGRLALERAPRLGQSDAPPPVSSSSDALGKMASSVQVLELRALEHDALLCSLVTEDEARHLWNISLSASMTYELHPGVEGELRSLVRRGLLRKTGDFKIHELPQSFELKEHFVLTDTGEMLLALRKHLKSTDTRRQDSLPPRAPESSAAESGVTGAGLTASAAAAAKIAL